MKATIRNALICIGFLGFTSAYARDIGLDFQNETLKVLERDGRTVVNVEADSMEYRGALYKGIGEATGDAAEALEPGEQMFFTSRDAPGTQCVVRKEDGDKNRTQKWVQFVRPDGSVSIRCYFFGPLLYPRPILGR